MEPKAKFLSGSKQERVAIAVFAPFISVLCVGCLISVEARFGGASGRYRLVDQLFHAMFFELFVAFLLFLALAFIWALFRPGWVGRTLRYMGSHVWHALCFFLLGFLVSLVLINVLR